MKFIVLSHGPEGSYEVLCQCANSLMRYRITSCLVALQSDSSAHYGHTIRNIKYFLQHFFRLRQKMIDKFVDDWTKVVGRVAKKTFLIKSKMMENKIR